MNSECKIPSDVSMQKENSIQTLNSKQKPAKKKNRNKSDLGENFIAPDGGWGWLVAIAAGMTILVSFPIMQQFGILFRERFKDIGISSTQITTIINYQQTSATSTGLFNGAIFRRFSIRQVCLAGSILLFIGLCLTVFADSFIFYFLAISIIYGTGRGLIFSASNIAVNTYFTEKRRSATACQYAVAGLGPIFLPYISTFFKIDYGVTWAVLFYAGLSLQNIVCALIYQPVKWHTKNEKDIELDHMQQPLKFVFGSNTSKLNGLDGSVNSYDINQHRLSTYSAYTKLRPLKVPKNSYAAFEPLLNPIPKIILPDETEYTESPQDFHHVQEIPSKADSRKPTILQRILTFFDFDLLMDFSYVNLVIGLTIIQIVEINFAFLTPFVLSEFRCDDSQIAKAMSLLAVCDLITRMSIPILTKNLKCSNKVVLLSALIGMCIGRTILVYSRSFTMVLLCFGWMGFCKGIRLVFWMLILPSYVPLKRLPAAIGLQRAIMGILSLIVGPLIGLVRDASNYGFTLHGMNAMCVLVTFSWIGEDLVKQFKEKQRKRNESRKTPPNGDVLNDLVL